MKLGAFYFLIICTGSSALADVPYEINKDKSEVQFLAVGKPSMLKIRGTEAKAEGILTLKDLALAGEVKVRLEQFTTGIDTRTKHMKEKYLEVQKFPDAVLKINPISIKLPDSRKDVSFDGTLTLHGETKPVSGSLKSIEIAQDQLNVDGGFKLKTSDFKINTPSFAGVTMAEEVEVEFKAFAKSK